LGKNNYIGHFLALVSNKKKNLFYQTRSVVWLSHSRDSKQLLKCSQTNFLGPQRQKTGRRKKTLPHYHNHFPEDATDQQPIQPKSEGRPSFAVLRIKN
jgi:hypothetical protein